jgi:probable HAF family extracellular repeat protein
VSDKHAVVWQDDTVTLLGEPEDFPTSEAEAVNDAGQILVRAIRSNMAELLEQAAGNGNLDEWAENVSRMPKNAWEVKQQSYLWHRGQWKPIDGLALALNNQGQVVGWSGGLSPYAFLWQNGEQVDLDRHLPADSGWHLIRANDINNHGQIVGYGKYHDKTRASLLTPIT